MGSQRVRHKWATSLSLVIQNKCPISLLYGSFCCTLIWAFVLSEFMLMNCGLEKTLESPLDYKEIQPVHSEGDQPWDFFGRNDAKAETPVLWPPHAKRWLIRKDSDAGRDWRQEEKGMTEDEMAGWHHWLDGRESEWTLGVGDGQRGLAWCDSWGRRESDKTQQLNWTELMRTWPATVLLSCILASISEVYNRTDIYFGFIFNW